MRNRMPGPDVRDIVAERASELETIAFCESFSTDIEDILDRALPRQVTKNRALEKTAVVIRQWLYEVKEDMGETVEMRTVNY